MIKFTELKGKRWKSACALAKGKNGEPLVAVAGGLHKDSRGMEIWNPSDGTVELVTEELPQEKGSL